MSKYDAPAGPPPPAYGSEQHQQPSVSNPQPAHFAQNQNQNVYPQGGAYFQGGPQGQSQYPPQQGQQGGYYTPGPQMGYAAQPQQGWGGPGGYPPQAQGGYYNGNGGYRPGYGPQGQYLDDGRRNSPGFGEALLASLACCCCLDACLLF